MDKHPYKFAGIWYLECQNEPSRPFIFELDLDVVPTLEEIDLALREYAAKGDNFKDGEKEETVAERAGRLNVTINYNNSDYGDAEVDDDGDLHLFVGFPEDIRYLLEKAV